LGVLTSEVFVLVLFTCLFCLFILFIYLFYLLICFILFILFIYLFFLFINNLSIRIYLFIFFFFFSFPFLPRHPQVNLQTLLYVSSGSLATHFIAQLTGGDFAILRTNEYGNHVVEECLKVCVVVFLFFFFFFFFFFLRMI
jgi:hypothetical protein